ncbi:MAG TPA: DNA topoisomerase IB [Gemmataceae bacterium]|nr:DNA topoisomerase IB [Gemmataceae bacterium]
MRAAKRRCRACGDDGASLMTAPVLDPVQSAKQAHLRYVNDHHPGIRRVRAGRGFRYVGPDGKTVRDPEVVGRIKALAIPPAWTDVWVCPSADGHIQATGKDARGRKQYRYHPRWRAVRDEAKYERTIAFGLALPALRRRLERDLARPGLPREKVLAAVVRLLETTLIRVGNEEYVRENRSFGLTTMRDRHVEINGGAMHFAFRGKAGIKHVIDLEDRRLARIVQRCQDVPGQELFQYLDGEGSAHTIDSADVNDYLRRVTGQEFTAKDFRTWAGTVLAARALQEFQAFDTEAQAKRNIVAAIERVAQRLGNTKAICRKCYVHPAVIEAYMDGSLLEGLSREVEEELKDSLSDLPPEEAAVLAFLQERLKREASPAGRNGHAARNG